MQAIFALEHGMAVDTGEIEQQGQFWGRQSWLGIRGDWGVLTAGRQYGPRHRAVGMFDPLGHGNLAMDNAPQALIEGVRFDNSLNFERLVGEVQVGAVLALGEQPNGNKRGRTLGAYAFGPAGPLRFALAVQSSTDANNKEMRTFGVGGTYDTTAVKLHLGYVQAGRDAGFASGANLSGAPLANISLLPAFNRLTLSGQPGTVTASRRDGLLMTGASWLVAPALRMTVGAYRARISGTTEGAARRDVSATRQTYYGVAQYFLSKRTDVYVEVDYNKYHDRSASSGIGGTVLNYNGFGARTGVMLGLRHSC